MNEDRPAGGDGYKDDVYDLESVAIGAFISWCGVRICSDYIVASSCEGKDIWLRLGCIFIFPNVDSHLAVEMGLLK